jgi:glyoxalase-like protein
VPERIDHVIVATPDLTALEVAFVRLGFHVLGGGQHPHLGTRNRIILLDEGYIELLAIADEQVASPAVCARIASAPGWIGFALQSADIIAEAAAMHSRGADVRRPRQGRLVAPDGDTRSWQTVAVASDDLFGAAEPIPFLIQHESAGAQHQRELAGGDIIAPHPNGALRLHAVSVAIADLDNINAAFARTYGLPVSGVAHGDALLGATVLTLDLPASGQSIILAQPSGTGLASDRMLSAGEGICCVWVAVADLGATQSTLQNRGVRVEAVVDGLLVPANTLGGAPLVFVQATE